MQKVIIAAAIVVVIIINNVSYSYDTFFLVLNNISHEFLQNEKLLKTYSESSMQAYIQIHLNMDDDFNNNNNNNSNNNCNSRGLTYQRV
jgi:hypothetical protein